MDSAGGLLQAAREAAGLSQVELARRAGVTQSVISAYESGARQPSLVTIGRLVAATGAELEVRVAPAAAPPSPAPARPGGVLAAHVRRHRNEILAVLDRFGLSRPRLFGSAARGDDRAGSDVDLLVDVPAGVGLLTLARCQAELEEILGSPVDLVPAADLKPGAMQQILDEAVAL